MKKQQVTGASVGERLRAERELQKVGRSTLARITGVAYSTLGDIENGYQETSTQLHIIAKAFPKPLRVEWLASGEMPKYVSDVSGVAEPKEPYHGVYLTRSGARLAEEWEKLDFADRAEIELDILDRVAKKKGGANRKSGKSAEKKDDLQ